MPQTNRSVTLTSTTVKQFYCSSRKSDEANMSKLRAAKQHNSEDAFIAIGTEH